uniref:Uncharacterized protein n=1 Tax=Bionectria ochroleuca TaxID=29856 RepID=A0A8H7NLP3_BIOOC
MLAVHQSVRMASDKSPSDPYLPFGYAIDPNQEPQDPQSLLLAILSSQTRTAEFLSSFFEDMTADQYNMPSFGEGLNFSDSWLDLPPQFMGTATSFGPQFGTSLASTNGQGIAGETIDFRSAPEAHLMPPPPLPHGHHQNQPHQPIQQQQQQQPQQQQPQPQQHNTQHHLQQHPQQHAQQHQYHSDDVLNAAATLLQNGAGSRSASGNHEYNFPRRPVAPLPATCDTNQWTSSPQMGVDQFHNLRKLNMETGCTVLSSKDEYHLRLHLRTTVQMISNGGRMPISARCKDTLLG